LVRNSNPLIASEEWDAISSSFQDGLNVSHSSEAIPMHKTWATLFRKKSWKILETQLKTIRLFEQNNKENQKKWRQLTKQYLRKKYSNVIKEPIWNPDVIPLLVATLEKKYMVSTTKRYATYIGTNKMPLQSSLQTDIIYDLQFDKQHPLFQLAMKRFSINDKEFRNERNQIWQ
jgi:hypothetical protein